MQLKGSFSKRRDPLKRKAEIDNASNPAKKKKPSKPIVEPKKPKQQPQVPCAAGWDSRCNEVNKGVGYCGGGGGGYSQGL